ncbi:MAG: aspartokinase [Fimbriimonadales bacterium]
MRIRVLKFGGTSIDDIGHRHQAALKVIRAKEDGYAPVVVVSAPGRAGAPYATDTLVNALREADPAVPPHPRELDMLMACGEILSAVMFSHLLVVLGHPATAFTGGQAGIVTDAVFGNARILEVNPTDLLSVLREGRIAVVCGFQGVSAPPEGAVHGSLTTLGRGGSDTTAAALGAALKAEAVDIYTDVDGVKTADPKFVPDAPTLRRLTYEEVAELSHLGAKVLHPRAAEIAMMHRIPLWVRNTFTNDPGTQIVPSDEFPGRRITGLTSSGQSVFLHFTLSDDRDARRIETEIFRLLGDEDIVLLMLGIGPRGFSFAVPRTQYPRVRDLLDGLVIPCDDGKRMHIVQIGTLGSPTAQAQFNLLMKSGCAQDIGFVTAEVTENCTVVSLVAYNYLDQPGVYYDVLSALHAAGVPVWQTADSENSISCLVPETDAKRAVSALHDHFRLSEQVED